MDDLDNFFAEQEKQMCLPDEDMEQYIQSRLDKLRRCGLSASDSVLRPLASEGSPAPRMFNLSCHSSASPSSAPSLRMKRQPDENSLRQDDKRMRMGGSLVTGIFGRPMSASLGEASRPTSPPKSVNGTLQQTAIESPGDVDNPFLHGLFRYRLAKQSDRRASTPQETGNLLDTDINGGHQITDQQSPRLLVQDSVDGCCVPGLGANQDLTFDGKLVGCPPFHEAVLVGRIPSQSLNHSVACTRFRVRNEVVGPAIASMNPSGICTAEMLPSPILLSGTATEMSLDQQEWQQRSSGVSINQVQAPSAPSLDDTLPTIFPACSTALPAQSSRISSQLARVSDVPGSFLKFGEPVTTTGISTEILDSEISLPLSSNRLDTKPSEVVNGSHKASSTTSRSKKNKEKAPLVTPLEYAQRLQLDVGISIPPNTGYLGGKRIFYVGGDMLYASVKTRGRMDYIVRHGGSVVPHYDSTIVTHIVTDAGVRVTLRALSLKSLSEIPNHIPTVRWSWILSGYRRKGKPNQATGVQGKTKATARCDDGHQGLDFEFLHAAFPGRIEAGKGWKNITTLLVTRQKSSEPAGIRSPSSPIDDNEVLSHISDFTQERQREKSATGPSDIRVLLPPPLDLRADVGRTHSEAIMSRAFDTRGITSASQDCKEDPFVEHYMQAKYDAANDTDFDSGSEDFNLLQATPTRKGYACDREGQQQQGGSVNQDIIDKLKELMELHKAKPSDHDRWRAFSYEKCIRALRHHPKRITSFSEACSLRGVGEKTAMKIMEIIETGKLRRIEHEKTVDVQITKLFQGIYGVGRHTAFMWYASGCRTLDDIKSRSEELHLSPAQDIGLKYYDDINSRMPREEVERIFNMIKPIALDIDNNLFIEVMGSFRRGKADCGDIDILITRPVADGNTHAGILPQLFERLHAAGILTEDLAVPTDFSQVDQVYHGLCKLPEEGAKRRRIDFLCVPWKSRGAALLYYTGDHIFNRSMRLKANVMGYSLNQRGLYAGVTRDPQNRQRKLCQGNIIASETEEDIFKILAVPWQEPHERVRE